MITGNRNSTDTMRFSELIRLRGTEVISLSRVNYQIEARRVIDFIFLLDAGINDGQRDG